MQPGRALLLLAIAALPFNGSCLDLLGRFPTKLLEGDSSPDNARPWDFTQQDIFHISQFKFETAGLSIETGPGDLGVGHSSDGAVWAVVIAHNTGTLSSPATKDKETIEHVWLRFHPKQINTLFPEQTISEGGTSNLFAQMTLIANSKFTSSWHAGMNAMIPAPKDFTVDVDVKNGPRRFFVVDTQAPAVQYVSAFEQKRLQPAQPLTQELAAEAFEQLWEAFDKDYAMFILRPEVDWQDLGRQYRPKALSAKSTYEFASVCAEMLRPLRDLHIWMRAGSTDVPVFNRKRTSNANPGACPALLGELKGAGTAVQWTVTSNKVGYLAIYNWSKPEVVEQCYAALDHMRDTRALIVDVRLNGGGSEDLAGEVAGRFLPADFIYAYSQFRNGPSHGDLTGKFERVLKPRGPWRYNRPVVLLIGQKCMSSNESFVAMMSGDPKVTTMGDHTCGSSGNPRMLDLPMGITVSIPRWIDYLPDQTVLDERGFQP
ncbi:MAG TPA: S41 family peptidase, partial [Patescibacteria group bacterium]|nr:S41 family peptidase [Patescibacteria group bacterium]